MEDCDLDPEIFRPLTGAKLEFDSDKRVSPFHLNQACMNRQLAVGDKVPSKQV